MVRTRSFVVAVRDSSRHARRTAVTILLVLGTLGGLFAAAPGATATTTSAPPAHYFTRHVVADSFNRTVRSGWGTAPVGGRYSSLGRSGRAMTVRGNAYLNSVATGRSRVQRTSTVLDADEFVSATLALPTIPRKGSWTVYTGVELRTQTNGSGYTATVRVKAHGSAALVLSRQGANGHPTSLHSLVALPRMAAGRSYTLQAAVVGTRVWARVWRTGRHAARWVTAVDRSSAAVRAGGRLSVVMATNGHRTSASAHYGSISVWAPVRKITVKPTPPVTTPTPPVTTPTPPVTTPTPPVTTPTPPATNPQHAAQVIASAGSVPVGAASYPVPSNAIYVATTGSDSGTGSITSPFATLAQALRTSVAGSTIVLRGGAYHSDTFVKSTIDVTIQNYPGEAVWFDGSVAVSGWTKVGSAWVHDGWTTQFDHSASFSSGSNAGGFVNSAYPMAAWPDQVFVDGAPLQQVAANPAAGEFAVDYNAKQIVIGSDPTGHAVRASDLTQAFVIAAKHVTLRGFGVRNYATPLPLIGTVYVGDSAGPATFENLVLTHNATTALATNNKADMINHVTTLENGMSGMGVGHADGTVVSNCRFERDNIEHFNDDPASAGIKVGRTDGIVIKDNYAVDGIDHAGIWTDENVVHFAITGNVVQDNGRSYGIENELSGTGIVADNTVSGSNYGYTAFDSGTISVYNNDFDNNRVWDIGLSQDNRWQPGKGTAGPNCQPSAANPWLVRNIVVANNEFGSANGSFQFYVLDKQTNRTADSMNLQVQGNQFAPRDTTSKPWAIGWGMGDNKTVHMYATPDAFNTGEGKSWPNAVAASAGTGYAAASTSTSVAMALPSDVAAAIGQAVGTRHIGAF